MTALEKATRDEIYDRIATAMEGTRRFGLHRGECKVVVANNYGGFSLHDLEALVLAVRDYVWQEHTDVEAVLNDNKFEVNVREHCGRNPRRYENI